MRLLKEAKRGPKKVLLDKPIFYTDESYPEGVAWENHVPPPINSRLVFHGKDPKGEESGYVLEVTEAEMLCIVSEWLTKHNNQREFAVRRAIERAKKNAA